MISIQQLLSNEKFEELELIFERNLLNSSQKEKNKVAIALVLLLINSPLNDIEKAFKITSDYTKNYNDSNEEIFLLKFYIEQTYHGRLSKESMQSILNLSWKRNQDCFKYLIADYYQNIGNLKYLELYKQISENSIDFVRCHYRLFRETTTNERHIYSHRMIKGLKKVYELNEAIDLLNFNTFINEKIKSAYLSKINFEIYFSEILRKCNND